MLAYTLSYIPNKNELFNYNKSLLTSSQSTYEGFLGKLIDSFIDIAIDEQQFLSLILS